MTPSTITSHIPHMLRALIIIYVAQTARACSPDRWFDTCALPCTRALVEEGRLAATRGGIAVVTWADRNYVPMLTQHWLPRVEAAGFGALVVAADESTVQAARQAGARAVLLAPTPPGSLGTECPLGSHGTGECMRRYHLFSYTKLSVPRCLVEAGLEVLALDADAFLTGDVVALARASGAHVATIMDSQSSYRGFGELSYQGEDSWGLPFAMRRSLGGGGARLGHCLGVAFFRGPAAAALLLRTQHTFIAVATAWWWGNASSASHLPWAAQPTRTLVQRAFAWELASWMRETRHRASLDDLRDAFRRARSSCDAQVVSMPAAGSLPALRVAYLPHDGTVEPADLNQRWCRRVSCANASWVVHCFGTVVEKMECAHKNTE